MSKFRKIILILLFFLVIIVVGFLLYSIFFKKEKPPVYIQPGISTTTLPFIEKGEVKVKEIEPSELVEGLPKAEDIFVPKDQIDSFAKGGATDSEEVVSKKVKGQDFSKTNNGMVYYDRGNQNFYRLLDDGSVFKMSDNKFYSVVDVMWSPTKNQAILEYPDEMKVLYDFDKDMQIASFPKEMKEFDFSINGEKIASKWVGEYRDYNYIVSSSPNGSNFKFVEPMGDKENDVQIVWSSDNEILATYRKRIDADRQEIFFINEQGKNLRSLVVDGGGFKGAWNPRGDKLLYSVFQDRTDFSPVLWVANGQGDGLGGGKRFLGVNTWVDKCSFSNTNNDLVYCAVPDYLPTGSGWYPELAKDVPYSIYRINADTGRKERIAQPIINGRRVTIDKIYLNKGDKKIYYTNESNGYLYSLDLEKQ